MKDLPGQSRSPEVASGSTEELLSGCSHFESNIGMVDGMATLDRAYWMVFVRVFLKNPVRRLGKIPQLESVQWDVRVSMNLDVRVAL